MTFGKCVYGKQDQVAYAYGEMKPDEAEAFRNHLESCPRCLRAVSGLAEAAALCRALADQPAPDVAWTRPAPAGLRAPPPRKPEGPRPLVWMPAGTALAALIVVVAVVALCQPIRPSQPAGKESAKTGPGHSQEQKIAAPAHGPAREPAQAAVRGAGHIRRARGLERVRFERIARLDAGDTLETGVQAPAAVALPDGSSLKLAAASSLRLESLAPSGVGDRLELLRGRVECRVAPHQAERPFSVAAGPGIITVKGTRFVVHLDQDGTLTVGVLEGVVELAPRTDPSAARAVRAGSKATLAAASPVRIGRLDLAARLRLFAGGPAGSSDLTAGEAGDAAAGATAAGEMAGHDAPGFGPGQPGAGGYSGAQGNAPGRVAHTGSGKTGEGDSASLAPGSGPGAAAGYDPAYREAPGAFAGRGGRERERSAEAGGVGTVPAAGDDAVADWARGLQGHSSLFFDAFHTDMRKGRFEDALRKIENYLSDPESPDRHEAVYLRAVCLEKLGRYSEAARVCRDYLKRWPRGPRAARLRDALLRSENQAHQD